MRRGLLPLALLAALALAASPAPAAVVAESEPNGRGGPDAVPASGLAPFASVYPNGSVLVTGTLAAGDVDLGRGEADLVGRVERARERVAQREANAVGAGGRLLGARGGSEGERGEEREG